jgi:predicted dienelactone hydrolase
MHAFALATILSLFFSRSATASASGLWSGSFEAGDLRGGLQLRVPAGAEPPSLILQPSGRTTIYRAENLHVSADTMSLEAPAGGGRRLRFEGRVTGQRLAGSVRLISGDSVTNGHWSAVRVQPVAKPGMLPAVHGQHPIGRTSFHWTDATREEPQARGEKRELVVHVWYPAERSAHCVPAPYLPDVALMGEALPKEVATFVNAASTGACLDAPLSRTRTRYPVVIFSPGDEFNTLGYSALEEDLASRGYIVAAIDFPFNAPVVVLSRGRVARPPVEEPPANLTADEMKKLAYDQTMAQLDEWAHDIAFVADRIQALDDHDARFKGHIDKAKIGALGHSAGGLASFHACQIDPALKACANLDGRYRARPYPISSATEAPKQPFLWIHTPQPALTDQQLAQRGMSRKDFDAELTLGTAIMAGVASGSDDVTIDQIGADHLDFTDFRIFERGISTDVLASRQRTLELTRAAIAAFFSEAFSAKQASIQSAMPQDRFPDITVVHFPGAK